MAEQNKRYLDYSGLQQYHSNLKELLESTATIRKTTNEWYSLTDFIPADGQIIVFTDYRSETVGGVQTYVPSIKIGDGVHNATTLQFVTVPKADVASKVEHTLTIGSYTYDGSADVSVPVYDGNYNE